MGVRRDANTITLIATETLAVSEERMGTPLLFSSTVKSNSILTPEV